MKTTKIEYQSPLLGESYVKISHKSGLTICVFPKNMTTTHAILAAKCGSLNRRARSTDGRLIRFPAGVAHYLEHKLFDGENGEDSFEAFSLLGADANAYTTYTHTAYYFSATRNEKKSLRELLTFATHPYFSAATVQKERGIIAEEIKMDRDLPWDRAFQNLLAALYGARHPLSTDICGTQSSISQITAKTLYDFYHLFYRPSNMILSVCGSITVKEVLSVVDSVLPAASSVEPCAPCVFPKPSRRVAKEKIEEKMPVAKPIFQIGFLDPYPGSTPQERLARDAGMLLLNEILFSKSGDFYNRLFEESLLTPSFSAGYSCEEQFAFNCISGESNHPDVVVDRLFAYLDEVKRNGISDADLERSRRVLYADEIRSYDSTEEIAGRMLSFSLDGADPFCYPELLQRVTRSDLMRLATELFQKNKLSLSLILPTEERSTL